MALTKITVSGVPHFCGDWNTTKAATGYKIYAIVCNEGSCFCSNVSDNKVEPKILSYDSETGEYTCSAGWNLVAIGVGQEYITEITTLEGLVTTLSGDVNNINNVIPTSASSSNKLVDKSYVDSAIATSSAVFRGTSEPGLTTEGQFLTWANTLQHDLNDYVYWNTVDSNGNTVYKRYKYNGSTWVYEYDLNNSSFSAEEWEAIQSGITDELVAKLSALPSNVELTSIFNTKQNVIQDLSVIRSGAAAGATAYQLPDNGIPKADLSSIVQTSLNKADSAYQKPQSGIPKSDLTSGVQASLNKADSAYQKANTGIPKTDLSSTVQSSLDKADSALQQHQDITGKADKDTDATPGNVAKFDENGNPVDSGLSSENIARKDGSYDTMSVGLAKNLEGRTNVTDSFFERTTGGDAEVANGLAQMTEVAGNSVKFNQLAHKTSSGSSYTKSGMTLTFNDDGTITVSGTYSGSATGDSNNFYPSYVTLAVINGHKYYISGGAAHISISFYSNLAARIDPPATKGIFTASGSGNAVLYHHGIFQPETYYNETLYPNLIDLTDIFGSDEEIAAAVGITTAEITTDAGVAAFEAWLASNIGKQAYYPYSPGSVLNVNMAGIETVGRNLLDPTTGKARILGAYSDVYGNYYGITGTHGAITFTSDMGETSTITPDEDGKFLLEEPGELSVADAGADCCVFLWWDGTQTDYVEHKDEKTYLDVTHIYGKLNGTGELVRVWPTGMPKVNGLKDTLRIEDSAVVARRYIGERAYTSGDESDTSVLTDGSTKTYYVLSTPEVYTNLVHQGSEYFADGTPVTLPLNYNDDNWGIERVLPINTSEALATAKPELTCKYSIDAVETMNTHADEIEDLYDKNEELDAKKPNKTGDYPGMAVGSAKVLEGTDNKVEDFVFTAPQCADGIAKLNEVRGKSLVWNQLVQNGDFANGTTGWIVASGSITATEGVLSYTVTSLPTTSFNERIYCGIQKTIVGHKYMSSYAIKPSKNVQTRVTIGGNFTSIGVTAGVWSRYVMFYTESSVGQYFGIWLDTEMVGEIGDVTQIRDAILIDLTLMFGAGHEPTTAEEFEAMFPLPYYAYNEGEIISNKTEAVEVTGRNQWDEELRSGYYNASTGEFVENSGYIANKNPIPVFPNTEYYVYSPLNSGTFVLNFWDANGNFLASDRGSISLATTQKITTPANAAYFGFAIISSAEIKCINLSDPSFNGQYEPYKNNTVTLNLPTLTGKLNGEGESVVVFPEGLKSAGSVYDEIVGNKAIKRVGVVDLGSLNWGILSISGTEKYRFYSAISTAISDLPKTQNLLCVKFHYGATSTGTNDNTIQTDGSTGRLLIYSSLYEGYTGEQFKAAMSGVLLYYELAEPLVYELDEGVPETFQAYKGGTLKQLPENGSEPTTAPCVMSVTYALDAVGILTGLPQNYVSKESLQAMLSAMQSAGLFASYTMTYNATTGKYEFTFTANS